MPTMINLLKDQTLFSDPDWAVKTGGEYDQNELVEVYRLSDHTQTVAYYAQFILDGTYP